MWQGYAKRCAPCRALTSTRFRFSARGRRNSRSFHSTHLLTASPSGITDRTTLRPVVAWSRKLFLRPAMTPLCRFVAFAARPTEPGTSPIIGPEKRSGYRTPAVRASGSNSALQVGVYADEGQHSRSAPRERCRGRAEGVRGTIRAGMLLGLTG